MARVKRGVTAHAKHRKVLKKAKGYYGRRKNTIRIAKQAVEKAMQYGYRDRKRKKRTFRALWIQRLNAAVRPFGLTYSRFIDGVGKAGILIDRKVLSDLAIREPATFQAIVEKAKAALEALANESTGEMKTLAQAAANTGDIAATRERFKPLSELATKMELPKDYAVALCPMYKGGSKWVQKKGTLANPYFGKTMLTCGSFVKS